MNRPDLRREERDNLGSRGAETEVPPREVGNGRIAPGPVRERDGGVGSSSDRDFHGSHPPAWLKISPMRWKRLSDMAKQL